MSTTRVDLDGTAARLWWRRIQAERDTALDWQRRAMLAEARVRELEAQLSIRRAQRDRLAGRLDRQRDWLTAGLAWALALGGLAFCLWLGGARFVGGSWS